MSASMCWPSSATSVSGGCSPCGGPLDRTPRKVRCGMDPQRRTQLCDALRGRHGHWQALAAEYGTPLLVLDPHRVAAQYSLLTEHLRGFRLHYAVKALPHPAVLTVLAASGSSFDVA